MRVTGGGTKFRVALVEGPAVDGHTPSVTELFRSIVEVAGRSAALGLMTGMGKDGASGLLVARRAGAFTITQSESTCVVYGMPRVAVELGASMAAVALDDIPERLLGRPRPQSDGVVRAS